MKTSFKDLDTNELIAVQNEDREFERGNKVDILDVDYRVKSSFIDTQGEEPEQIVHVTLLSKDTESVESQKAKQQY